ncbi:MAG: hypothetical protein UX14_C0023G0007 [Parcubacteria group bacterium GW2011_GWF1_45_5]|nr:MAG: hypothetical protein UX14_C0023G0007 [Parcubacteria group bacterium GW2011_GWF1_45_5]
MADLFLGQSMSEAFQFISAGTAHTFTFNFQPDKVVFNNLTHWTSTAGKLPISVWFRGQTTAAHAYQQKVIDSAAAASFNFVDLATNGYTVACTTGGVTAFRALIAGVTAADPVVVTTTAAHGFQTNQIVRITDLGSDMPTARGMDQLNNNRYQIVVLTSTTFSLKDPVSGEPVDGTGYTAWVSGGRVVLETRILSLNNPQVSPYESTPYVPNEYSYDPVTYKLTVGTSVMGADSDVFLIESYKWGKITDLGDLVT